MSFAFSSSSDSEDDDDRPVSYAKNTEFIAQICNGRYEAQDSEWPNELQCKCHFAGHAKQSTAPLTNGFANSSMFDTSHQQMNGSRILDSSAILNTTQEEEFVLIKVGDKFQRVRVVTDTEILQSAVPEQRPVVSRMKHTHEYHYLFILYQACAHNSGIMALRLRSTVQENQFQLSAYIDII